METELRKSWSDRSRWFRTLTFWLRPAFALRAVNRFQAIAGFDRAIALASSALTAIVPAAIVFGALATKLGGRSTAERIIDRYDLTGSGADAIEKMFEPTNGTETSIGIIGAIFVLLAVLSFSRAVQRMFEQTWELPPLSVRNTLNGLRWTGVMVIYFVAVGFVRSIADTSTFDILAWGLSAPLTFGFLLWSGWTLSGKRIGLPDLLPFAAVGTVLLTIYSIGAQAYVPHMFNSYAGRYGAIGAVFAIISALFCVMVVVVGSAALGREVDDELDKIRRGERPPDDEIRKEWDALITDVRARWTSFKAGRASQKAN